MAQAMWNESNSTANCQTEHNSTSSKLDNLIAGTVVFVTSLTSVLVNLGATFAAHYLKSFHGSYTRICISLATADCAVLSIYAFWTAPCLFSELCRQTPLSLSTVGKKVGQLSLLFWYASAYTMLVIAANRFTALCQPLRYPRIWSDDNTNKVISLCWLAAILHTLLFFVPGCNYYFDPGVYMWSYDRCTECGLFNMRFEVYYTGSVILFTFVVNIATWVGMKKRMMMVISFNIFSTWGDGKWFLFFTTTLAWETSHAINGWLFLLFSREIRNGVLLLLRTGGNRVELSKVRISRLK